MPKTFAANWACRRGFGAMFVSGAMLAASAGCSGTRSHTQPYASTSRTRDAGVPDAVVDAGHRDAGSLETGSRDAGSRDAGSRDATTDDASIEDAGIADADGAITFCRGCGLSPEMAGALSDAGPRPTIEVFADAGGGTTALSHLRAIAAKGLDGGTDGGLAFPTIDIVGLSLPGPFNNWTDLRPYMAEGYDGFSEYNYPNGTGTKVDGGTTANPTENSFAPIITAGTAIWADFADYSTTYKTAVPKYIPSVTIGWDPRPWQETPFYYDRDPVTVADFFLKAELWAASHASQNIAPEAPLMVLEARNELGEGSFIVPTVGDHGAYLEQIAEVIPP